MTRDDLKLDILRLVARRDGEWYWYQLDRALSGTNPGYVGPFLTEIRELVAEGMIELRPNFEFRDQLRYWLTDAGREAASNA